VFSRLFFSAYKVPSPYCYRCPLDKERDNCNIACLNPLENLLGRKSKEICAVIIEPMVLCAAGMIVYPQEYLKGAAQLAKKYGVHLIVDEVATGFGRTGKMFACEYAGDIAPDFLCLSKGITGGYLPLAATLTTDKIYRAFYAPYLKKKTFYHGHTYSANPISCSAALASLSIFQQENTLQRIRRITPLFQSAVERFKELPFVGDVRCLGLIGAIELVRDKKTKEHFNFQERIGFEIYKRGLKDSLVLRPLGDITYLFLPLGIKRKELEDIMRRVYRLIRSLPEFVGKGARE
jgi:adenosylmethionine-8-amino-7-oxononanoate aminotransferase